ncbi:MAG TPA: M14 family zinc carboxypeptidase, partial [Thermoanaerobaculia bacterium]|nr:M14 family zinc carboxypeptidase [Thermoanaerobaculia bacterium]
MHRTILLVLLAALCAAPALAAAELPPHFAALPPELPWEGKSLELALPPDHEWVTPFEAGGLVDSPSYDVTVAWLRRLADASEALRMVTLGRSPEGREIWMVVASTDGVATPEGLRASGKPTLLAHSGIHSGEID